MSDHKDPNSPYIAPDLLQLAPLTLPEIRQRQMRDSKLFRVEQLDLRFSNGEERRYERVLGSAVGAVLIVALRDDGKVLLIREYACGTHSYEVGLPKGRLEPDESVLHGANRELREETGFAAGRLEEITSLTLAPGYMVHRTHVVLARDLYPSPLPGDEPEPIEVIPWAMDDLLALALRDDCSEGRCLAALYLVRDHLQQIDARDQN
jgi:ADP-ribose diphosphatase